MAKIYTFLAGLAVGLVAGSFFVLSLPPTVVPTPKKTVDVTVYQSRSPKPAIPWTPPPQYTSPPPPVPPMITDPNEVYANHGD